MRNCISAALIVAGLIATGCTRDDKIKQDHERLNQREATTRATGDACPHCEGMQTASAAGKCPVCGMKMH